MLVVRLILPEEHNDYAALEFADNLLTFHNSKCIVVISIPNESVSVKVDCVHLVWGATHKMPRYIITFAHAQSWQIAVHIPIDVSHLVALLEIGIISKRKEKNNQNKHKK